MLGIRSVDLPSRYLFNAFANDPCCSVKFIGESLSTSPPEQWSNEGIPGYGAVRSLEGWAG
jgi:hypothetical protein